jgi:MSHA biogenesis protein MshO
MSGRHRNLGFTLVEMVVSLTVATIVVGFMAMFIATPVESYFAQTRRAELLDSADRARQFLTADLRNALPMSVQTRTNGSFRVVRMIEIQRGVDGSTPRYVEWTAPAPDDDTSLHIDANDSGFTVLGRYLQRGSAAATLSARRLIVGVPGSNPYTNVRFMSAPLDLTITPASDDSEVITTSTPVRFQSASPSDRIFLTTATATVAYLCDLTQGTLRRYDGFAMAANIAAVDTPAELAGAASNELIAEGVSACTFRTVPPSQTRPRGLGIFHVRLNDGAEVVQVFDQVALEIGP